MNSDLFDFVMKMAFAAISAVVDLVIHGASA